MRSETHPTPAALHNLARRSVEIIRANQDRGGAYIACPTFPVYRYCWLRDGSFIADAMSRAGDVASAEAFFGWCARILEARAERVESLVAGAATRGPIELDAFLPARYALDGRESTEEWTDFQLDGYGTWLWALGAHAERHGRPVTPFLAGALLSARYVAAFWEHPSYDWWEEHVERRHVSTLAALYGGLRAIARWSAVDPAERTTFAEIAEAIRDTVVADASGMGRLHKWLGGTNVDASLVSVATPFRLLEPGHPLVRTTIEAIESELVHSGGVHRYLGDTYYGGGEWLLLAALLGWQYAETGRIEDAWRELSWVASKANERYELPEQASEHLLAPAEFDSWQARWGPIAQPLLWSHAMFLSLALELGAVEPSALVREPLPSDAPAASRA